LGSQIPHVFGILIFSKEGGPTTSQPIEQRIHSTRQAVSGTRKKAVCQVLN
jgi:hypothetical protein